MNNGGRGESSVDLRVEAKTNNQSVSLLILFVCGLVFVTGIVMDGFVLKSHHTLLLTKLLSIYYKVKGHRISYK